MTAFIIVVSVAITVKLLFLSLSLYFTLKNKEIDLTQTNNQIKAGNKSLLVSWKEIPRIILPRSIYCPNANTKELANKS